MNAKGAVAEELRSPGNSTVNMLVKAGISFVLVSVLILKSNSGKYADLALSASPGYLIGALCLTVAAVLISAYKWQLLADPQCEYIPFRSFASAYFIGLFFNNFMPSSIGGDVVRVYELKKITNDGPAAAASVITERVLAAFTLGLVVIAGLLFGPEYFARFQKLVFLFVAGCSTLFVLILYAGKISAYIEKSKLSSAGKIKGILDAINLSIASKPVLFKVIAYSIIFQLMVVLVNVLIARAFGLTIPVASMMLAVPIISAVTMLPITLNGFGLREAMYVYFFSHNGISTEEAVTISVFFLLVVMVVSLVGGVLFAVRR